MGDGQDDAGAPRYDGDDPQAVKAFADLRKLLSRQRLQPDPIIQIITSLPQSGTYLVRPIEGRTDVNNGTNAASSNWGMQARTGDPVIGVNVWEANTGTHWCSSNDIAIASRRLNNDGTQTYFFNKPANPALLSGTNIATPTNGLGFPPGGGDTNVLGGGSDHTCRLYLGVSIANSVVPDFNGDYQLTYLSGDEWNLLTTIPNQGSYEFTITPESGPPGPWRVTVYGSLGEVAIFQNTNVAQCPDLGSYVWDSTFAYPGGNIGSATTTCTVF